jgi:hypothetical protein
LALEARRSHQVALLKPWVYSKLQVTNKKGLQFFDIACKPFCVNQATKEFRKNGKRTIFLDIPS